MSPLVSVGLARFAYGLLLPPMRADLGWSYTEAGTLNTANAVGYLLGAVVSTHIIRGLGARVAVLGGLSLTASALLGSAGTTALVGLALLRLAAGITGAVAFVAGGSLAAHAGAHLPIRRAATLLGIYVAGGAGIGVVVSGIGVPAVLASPWGWRGGWLLLGALSLVALVPAALASRHVRAPRTSRGDRGSWERGRLATATTAYLLFGAGYIGYVTFVVALLRDRLGPLQTAAFWVVLGASAVATIPWWGRVLARATGARGLAVVLALAAAGAVIPVVGSGPVAAFGSAVVFGAAFLACVTAVTVLARRSLPQDQWGPAIGGLTIAFAVGQCLGPLLSGAVADMAGSGVRAGLGASAIVLILGAGLALVPPTAVRRGVGGHPTRSRW